MQNLGEKVEASVKAHEHFMTHLAWHPTSADTFATIGGKDRSVRCAAPPGALPP
jgi:hypothetical protein